MSEHEAPGTETPEHAMDERVRAALRDLPRVDDLLADPVVAQAGAAAPRALVRESVRTCLDEERARILAGQDPHNRDQIISVLTGELSHDLRPRLRCAVNATGVVVHTNLGRAPLSAHVAAHVADVASHYSTLEFDVATGSRGSRHELVEGLLCELTGAEAACVVNNNAAAVMLVLAELGRGREVIVSRGELIEIGGSFRIPDIMELSGATMVEVGTTNKTHPRDFERAINEQTALVLKVHPSNYRVMGFHEEVDPAELCRIAHEHGVLVYEDQGSGMLLDLAQGGIASDEPTVSRSLAQGVDVVSCSGDKILGAGQAGIVFGSAEVVDRIKHNPLMRAMRPGKLTLAALEATLRDYLDPAGAWQTVPTLKMLSADPDSLRKRAEGILARARAKLEGAKGEGTGWTLEAAPAVAYAGGGALPLTQINSWAVRLRVGGAPLDQVRLWLIQQPVRPIVAYVSDDWLVCDVRTLVDERDERDLADGLAAAVRTFGLPTKG